MRGIVTACAVGAVLAGCGGDPEPGVADSEPGAARVFSEARDVPAAPVIDRVRLEPREPSQDDVVRAVVSARDPNGDPVELDFRWFVDDVQRSGAETLELADVRKGAVVEVEVVASDGSLRSDPLRAKATVIDRPPRLGGIALDPPEEVAPGSPVKVAVVASDPDGDRVQLEYRWLVNGEPERDVEGDVFVAEGLEKGDTVQVEVRASDRTNTTRWTRSDPVRVGSAHPEITSRPPGFRKDGVFRYAVEAEDPDGDRLLRYRLDEAPEGMVIDSVIGELTWRPAEGQTGVHPVKIVVRDSTGLETSQSFQVTVRETSAEDGAGDEGAASPAAVP